MGSKAGATAACSRGSANYETSSQAQEAGSCGTHEEASADINKAKQPVETAPHAAFETDEGGDEAAHEDAAAVATVCIVL